MKGLKVGQFPATGSLKQEGKVKEEVVSHLGLVTGTEYQQTSLAAKISVVQKT